MVDDAEIEQEVRFILENAEDIQASVACVKRLLANQRLRWVRAFRTAAHERYQMCARLAHTPGKLKEIASLQGDAGGLRLAAGLVEGEGQE